MYNIDKTICITLATQKNLINSRQGKLSILRQILIKHQHMYNIYTKFKKKTSSTHDKEKYPFTRQ